MKQFQSLSESEMEVMRVVWASPTPVTSAEMLERFSAKGWKIQTVSTFLTRLVDKGALKMEKRGRGNLYSPALTPEEYRRREARNVVDTMYGGSMLDFMAAFYGGNHADERELDELRDWFEREMDKR